MISSSQVEACSPVYSDAATGGRFYGAIGGTPLAILLDCHKLITTDAKDKPTLRQEVAKSSMPEQGEYSPHCKALQEISKGMAQKLRYSIHLARNVVTPLVREVNDECVKELAKQDADNPVNVNIRQVVLPDLYQDETLGRMLEQYRFNTGDLPEISPGLRRRLFTDLSETDVVKTAETHSEVFNGRLRAMVDNNPGLATVIPTRNLHRVNTASFYQDHSVMMTFLYLRGVSVGKAEHISMDSLDMAERTELSKVLGAYGGKLYTQIREYERFVQSGDFHLNSPNYEYEIHVHNNNFMKWIAEGGTGEQLIGFYLSNKGKGVTYISRYRANAKTWEEEYERHSRRARNRNLALGRGIVENIVRRNIVDYINAEIEDNIGKATANRRLIDAQNRISYNGKSIDNYCMMVFAAVLGEDNEVYNLLSGIDVQRATNPDMDIATAAERASIRRVAKWLASQMTVTIVDRPIG